MYNISINWNLKEIIHIMKFDVSKLEWTRKPKDYSISADKIEIITNPHTDLWQRTYYHFRNDNAPVLQMKTNDKFFSFTVKTQFQSKCRFDQCGIVILTAKIGSKALLNMKMTAFNILEALLQTTDIPIGQLLKLM